MKTEYFICWNEDKTEGFVTTDKDDAKSAKTGKPHRKLGYTSISTAAEAFYNTYCDDALTVEAVTVQAAS
jgi:hypothetical protein